MVGVEQQHEWSDSGSQPQRREKQDIKRLYQRQST